MRRMFAPLLILVMLTVAPTAGAAISDGGPWTPQVTSIAVLDDSTWLAVAEQGVARTVNAGQTWTQVTDLSKAADGDEPSASITRIAASQGIAYAVGQRYGRTSSTYPYTVLLRSRDRGASWAEVSELPRSVTPTELVVDPTDGRRVLVSGREMGASGASYLFVSADAGLSWAAADLAAGSGGQVPQRMRALGDGVIVGVDTSGLVRSLDGGRTWSRLEPRAESGVAISLSDVGFGFDSHLYAVATTAATVPRPCPSESVSDGGSSTANAADILRSVDRGSTWVVVGQTCVRTSGAPAITGEGLLVIPATSRAIDVMNVDGSNHRRLASIPFAGAAPVAATTATAALFATQVGVLVVDAGGVRNMSRGIESWGLVDAVSVSPIDRRVMIAALPNAGLYRTVDGGITWNPAMQGMMETLVGETGGLARVLEPTFTGGSHRVTVAAEVSGTCESVPGETGCGGVLETAVLRSEDAGASWARRSSLRGWRPTGPIRFPDRAPGRAYVPLTNAAGLLSAGPQCGLGRSDDDLETIEAVPIPVDCTTITEIETSPDDADLVIAAGEYVESVPCRRSNVTICTRSSGVVLRSTDGGRNWVSIPIRGGFGGNSTGAVRQVVFAPADPNRVYLWERGSQRLCESNDGGVGFSCRKTSWSITSPEGISRPGYLTAFSAQPDGSLIVALADAWVTDRNAKVKLMRSADGGTTWQESSDVSLPVVQQVLDLSGGTVRARTGPRRSARPVSRNLVLASAGVLKRRIIFFPPGLRVNGRMVRVIDHAVVLKVRCAAKRNATCRGRLSARTGKKIGPQGRARFVTFRTIRFSIKGQRTGRIRLPLAAADRSRVGRAPQRSVPLNVRVVPAGARASQALTSVVVLQLR